MNKKYYISVLFSLICIKANCNAVTEDNLYLIADGGSSKTRMYLCSANSDVNKYLIPKKEPSAKEEFKVCKRLKLDPNFGDTRITYGYVDKEGNLRGEKERENELKIIYKHLINNSIKLINKNYDSNIIKGIHIYATAGVRDLINREESINEKTFKTENEIFMNSVINNINLGNKEVSFNIVKDEGIYSWIANNVNLKTKAINKETFSIFEVGGQSAQMTAKITGLTEQRDDLVSIQIGNTKVQLSSVTRNKAGKDASIRYLNNQGIQSCNWDETTKINITQCKYEMDDLIAETGGEKIIPKIEHNSTDHILITGGGITYALKAINLNNNEYEVTNFIKSINHQLNKKCVGDISKFSVKTDIKYKKTFCSSAALYSASFAKQWINDDQENTAIIEYNDKDLENWTTGAFLMEHTKMINKINENK